MYLEVNALGVNVYLLVTKKGITMEKDNNKELIWGEVKVKDLLKNIYKGKSLDQMSEKEVDRMLEDLI